MEAPNTVGDWLNVALGIAGIISLAVTAFFYSRSEITKNTQFQLKELVDALEMRVGDLEKDKVEKSHEIRNQAHQIEELQRENTVLRSLVSGEVKIQELIVQSREYYEKLLAAIQSAP